MTNYCVINVVCDVNYYFNKRIGEKKLVEAIIWRQEGKNELQVDNIFQLTVKATPVQISTRIVEYKIETHCSPVITKKRVTQDQ